MTEQNQMKIEGNNLCMHVTALKAIGHFLFVAEGNQVSVFNLNLKKFLKSEIVFYNSSVHGIRADDHSHVLFFGSKSLKIYHFDPTSSICLTSFSEEIILHDWIFDVQWLIGTKTEQNHVAIVTAHNCMTVLNINSKRRIKSVQCAENCILYAASILLAHENALVVAVGTVFKQILLWSPNSHNEINSTKIPFHCLEGHKGVIFSVSYNKHHKLLSSTSDDRSIRLWKVNSALDDESSLEFWEKSEICLNHILFAHESRVWTSAVLEDCILSVGEDSCICFWSMQGELLRKKKCHKGGSIWCLETTNTSLGEISKTGSDNSYIAITGGSDGGVYCWEVQSILSTNPVLQISLCIRSAENDFPRSVSIICSDNRKNLMATTDKGWLSFYDVDLKCWKDVFHDANFVSYCISSISSKNTISLGNLNGELVLFNFSEELSNEKNFKKFKIHSGKIFSLHWVDENNEHLLSCAAEGFMINSLNIPMSYLSSYNVQEIEKDRNCLFRVLSILWKVNFQNGDFSVSNHFEFHLPKCKPHWWSTCAVYLNNSYLIVGDRGGSINFYSPDTNLHKTLEPNIIFKSIHGENGVTDIKEHQSLIYSAGRDGRVLLYCISEKSLHLLHAIKISHDLEWIGKILFYGSDLLLLGFHTKYFIVWSSSLESTVMTVECGGGHRSWDFQLNDKGVGIFTAIKKKDIIFASEDLHFTLNKSVLKAGVSGKEFCQTCYLFNSELNNSESMAVFAAGGEDNTLRIVGTNDNFKSSEMVTLNSLSGHLSSIRSLAKTSMREENAYLLASVGGRAQMMLWKIKNNLNIECEQLASYILSAPERKNRKSLKESQSVHVDPQTRLMDVTVHTNCTNHCSGENYIIALACSDSFFRVYDFDATQKLLSLCYNIQMGEHCILKLSCIQNSIELNKNMFFVVATTSGHLTFIKHEDVKSLNVIESINYGTKCSQQVSQFQVRLHQSGINALDIKHISGKNWLICTGGDDNAICAVIIHCDSLIQDWEVIAKEEVQSAHASQITGIKFLGENIIVSAAIDQRINLWKWNFDGSSLNITMEASKISAIPDIADLQCWKNKNKWTALICGEGIESLSIVNT